MKSRDFVNKLVLGVVVIGAGIYGVMYVVSRLHHPDVAIQTIQDEVDLDSEKCTDGIDDCKFNTEFFTETWLYTGPHNMDKLVNFPENVWEKKE